MSITAADIKLVASRVMDDVPEGGGAPVATVIADAVSNSIFSDISELDRAGGRVNLRKTFVSVVTNDTDGYFGGNIIVAEPPEDPNVSITVFSTRDTFDTRDSASSRVEAYLNAGPEWSGLLYENHIENQRSIQILSRTNVTPPPIGRTLLLRGNEGISTQFEQYVRVTRVASEVRTFTDGQGDFTAAVVTCDISDPLRYDFPGTSANRFFARANGAAILRDTTVVDAGSYCGAVPLTVAAAVGDVAVRAESVYTQIVPNSRTEASVLDQTPSAGYEHELASTPRRVTVGGLPLSQRIRVGQENRGYNYVTIVTPLPAPGSVRVTFRALGRNYEILDNGDGTLGGSGAAGAGTVNYLTGSVSVTLSALPDDRSAIMFYWGQNVAYTNRAGQAGFRAPSYSFELAHRGVVRGSVSFTWTSGGIVKTATANSAGIISGHAVGEINYNSGLVALRPTAMLDPGGEISITYQWSTVVEEPHPGLTPDGSGSVAFTLASEPVPGSIEVSWLVTRETSASSGGSSGSGATNKSGTSNTDVTFVNGNTFDGSFNGPEDTIDVNSLDLPNMFGTWMPPETRVPVTTTTQTDETTGSSYTTASTQTSKISTTTRKVVTDTGTGQLHGTFGTVGYVAKSISVKVVADYDETSFSSNYESADSWESLNATGESGGPSPGPSVTEGGGGSASAKGGAYGSTSSKELYGSSTLMVRYKTGVASPTSVTETYTPPGTVVDLCPYTKDQVVPGSVRFTWMGTVYEDYEGVIYRGRTLSNPGTPSGYLSYTSGLAAMEDYVVSGSPTAFTLDALWTRKGRASVANMTFATSLAPLKPSALILSVVDTGGTQRIGTSALDGSITGTHIRGVVDYESGLVEVQFGDYVLDSSLTAAQKLEWWYSAGDIITSGPSIGKIWRPWPVDPDTLRYSFVSYFYLPLDASILGLDPVRLPQDGRVPIFRPGGFAVVGHTGSVGPATVSNGQTIDCGRVRLSRVRVIGNNGVVITTGYSANLNAGTVTFTNVSGYSQPVTVEHRIEDMAMVSDVQINGTVSFTRQITHDYPIPGSYLSSALVAGDLRARVSIVFDQVSFGNVWSDVQVGDAATGTFNVAFNPIVVTNSGALGERWAIVFTNSTQFNIVGEHVGVIGTGNTSTDCAPLNPASGTPYFSIPAVGWGLGWATGNVLRFNTVGAFFPVWVVRTIQQGPETVTDDNFTLLIRGDVDAP